MIDETLRRAGLGSQDLDAVAVANTPGLAGSLLVGVVAAKTLALALGIPLVAVNHLQAHIYACRLASGPDVFPCVGLIVSGGHTSLYRCRGPLDFQLLGATIDDAAGEAFDKVAAMLGLAYPGGPSIQRAAARRQPPRLRLPPRLLQDRQRLDFSFSGLKTAVRYAIAGPGSTVPSSSSFRVPTSASEVADLAASFQEAVVDCLVGKAFLALEQTGMQTLCVGGGVAANARLRQRLEEEARQRGMRLFIAPAAPLHRQCRDGRHRHRAIAGRPGRVAGPGRRAGHGAEVRVTDSMIWTSTAGIVFAALGPSPPIVCNRRASTLPELPRSCLMDRQRPVNFPNGRANVAGGPGMADEASVAQQAVQDVPRLAQVGVRCGLRLAPVR